MMRGHATSEKGTRLQNGTIWFSWYGFMHTQGIFQQSVFDMYHDFQRRKVPETKHITVEKLEHNGVFLIGHRIRKNIGKYGTLLK